VVIVGAGTTASLAHIYLAEDSPHDVVAFAVEREYVTDRPMRGLPVVPLDEVADRYPPSDHRAFVAVGYGRVNRFRAGLCQQVKDLGYDLISYVSTRADIWTEHAPGENSFIMPRVVIEPFARLGADIILWTGAHVSHDTKVGDHCFMSSHSVLGGHSSLGAYSFVGVNAAIRDDVHVAEDCVVGAGATILKSTRPGQVIAGPGGTVLKMPSNRLMSL
jgi:sugar O-acyltransferase (sialic acid O-acetyltransferase NeuD family)